MTSPSKDRAEAHMDAARELIGELQDGVCGCDMCTVIIRDALAASFAEGMKHAAAIIKDCGDEWGEPTEAADYAGAIFAEIEGR